MGQFGISQPVLRREDPRLLRGEGRFVDDVEPAGLAHCYVVRSPHAHAAIESIDVEAARAAPGVIAVYTSADLAADAIGSIPCITVPKVKEGTSFVPKRQPLLAGDRARFVGDAVAFVVAETADQARDAAELIEVAYRALPAVTAADAGANDDAPLVWDDVPANRSFAFELGDRAAVEAAFAKAERIVSLDVVNNRVV
jgi:aerobic carbon-monoxide dehydrogenase large subunit